MKNSHPKTTPGFLLLFDIVLPARCLVAVLVVFCFPWSWNFFDGSTKSNHIVVLAGTCTHLPHHLLPCLQLDLEQLFFVTLLSFSIFIVSILARSCLIRMSLSSSMWMGEKGRFPELSTPLHPCFDNFLSRTNLLQGSFSFLKGG